MPGLTLPASTGTPFDAKAFTTQIKLQTSSNAYRDMALPSFKRKIEKPAAKRTQADLDEELHIIPCKDAESLALDQRLHEFINNLYFDVFPDEKAKTPDSASGQTQVTSSRFVMYTPSKGKDEDIDMDNNHASTRSTEILTSLISLEKMGCKVYWEDTEELKRQVTEILRGIQPLPTKPLPVVGMEEVRSEGHRGRTYRPLPRRAKSPPSKRKSDIAHGYHEASNPVTLSTYLRRSSADYEETASDHGEYRYKRQHLSPESFQSELHQSMHYAFPDAWPVMIKSLDLDATEEDVKIICSQYGKVVAVHLVEMNDTSRSMLVLLTDEFNSFTAVRRLDGIEADGRILDVYVPGHISNVLALDEPLH